jgi:hypothetical protein
MNAQDAFNNLAAFIPEIVAAMPKDTFNSHEFILMLAHKHQQEYIEALYPYREANPFQKLHKAIAQRLGNSELVNNLGEVNSEDIFGNKQTATQWQKR